MIADQQRTQHATSPQYTVLNATLTRSLEENLVNRASSLITLRNSLQPTTNKSATLIFSSIKRRNISRLRRFKETMCSSNSLCFSTLSRSFVKRHRLSPCSFLRVSRHDKSALRTCEKSCTSSMNVVCTFQTTNISNQ
jgi:hypothetical protein